MPKSTTTSHAFVRQKPNHIDMTAINNRRNAVPKLRKNKAPECQDLLQFVGTEAHDRAADRKIKLPFENDLQPKISSDGKSTEFNSRKLSLFKDARNKAKEIVNFSTTTLEGTHSLLSEMRSEEIDFKKFHEDCQGVILSNKTSLNELTALCSLVCKDLGQTRAQTLEGACTMLKNTSSHRHEILKDVSKSARQQLEDSRHAEKMAEDASKLIEKFKNLVRPA